MRRAVLLFIIVSSTLGISAQTFKSNLMGGCTAEFEVLDNVDGEVALVKGKNNGAMRMEIPETVSNNGKSYQVTVLASYSMKDCDNKLRELIIPSTVREIQTSLFVYSSTTSAVGTAILKYYTLGLAGKRRRKSDLNEVELTNLQIGKGVKVIAENAFMTYCNVFNKTKSSQPIKAHISELPDFVTAENADTYGLSEAYVREYWDKVRNGGYTGGGSNIANVSTSRPTPGPVFRQAANSDIDVDIPKQPETNKKTFAIIIANEEYQRESRVDFALNDGRAFNTYCRQVLGMPEKNVHYVENATLNNFIYELDWAKKVCEAYKGTADVIIYYAGHGIPDEKDGKAYLLPVDGSGQNTRTCYALDEFYKTVGEMKARQVTIFLDACFSGAKRNGEMQMAARGVAIKSRAAAMPQGKLVVFSAAKGDETAYSYKEKGHGLFTYFLLKKLKESKGNATLGELTDYVNEEVAQFSIVENGKSQTPTVTKSRNLQQTWRSKKLK